MLIDGPNTTRAAATTAWNSSSDGSGAARIAVPGLARKFCTMISWMWP
jgi:hypothetical protein